MISEPLSVTSRVEPSTPSTDELVAYLHREFGECPDYPDALQSRDLRFSGAFQFAHRTEHVWQFPCSSERGGWLRVVEDSLSGFTGWSTEPPPGT